MMKRPYATMLARLLGLCLVCLPTLAHAVFDEEFVGPFASWLNVKDPPYNATGDGITNDQPMIQAALDAVGTGSLSPVLYFPPGTYKINTGLHMHGPRKFHLVGASPASVILKWGGAAGGIMLTVERISYSKISRLTFDGDNGANDAAILIDQWWTSVGGADFDTGNTYTDLVLKNATLGLRGGVNGEGFAETTLHRIHFLNLGTGAWVGNFNALDLWIWDSLFENCTVGVTNTDNGVGQTNGAGDFKVYNSVFLGSAYADFVIGNSVGSFAYRGNTSIGSWRVVDAFAGNSLLSLQIQNNVILDTVSTQAIMTGQTGPTFIVDNTIRSLAGATGTVIGNNTTHGNSDMVVLGNTLTVPSGGVSGGGGRLLEQGTSYVSRASLASLGAPTLPGTPPQKVPNVDRTVFNVSAGASGSTMQTAIDNAVAVGGGAAVHFNYGDYFVSNTLTIPANANIQLLGDGHFPDVTNRGSVLRWQGGAGPLLDITGPAKVLIRDLGFYGNNTASLVGIRLHEVDQTGSRVWASQLELRQQTTTHFFSNGLDHLQVDLYNTAMLEGFWTNKALTVVGGPLLNAGTASGGRVNWWTGLTNQDWGILGVTSGGVALVQDVFNEQNDSYPRLAVLDGKGTVTMSNLFVGAPQQGIPTLEVAGHQGTVALLGLQLEDHLLLSGTGTSMTVLTLGLLGGTPGGFVTDSYLNTTNPAADARLGASRQIIFDGGTTPITNEGTLDSTFVNTGLASWRSVRAAPMQTVVAGASDIRFDRVWVTRGNVGIQLDPGGAVVEPEPDITTGLVAWWQLNETGGPTAVNSGSAGTALNGTLQPVGAEPSFVAGQVGNGLSLNGTTQYALVPSSAALNMTGDITIGLWVKRSSLAAGTTLLCKCDANHYGYSFYIEDPASADAGKLAVYTDAPSGTWRSTSTITDTNWHHVVMTRSGPTMSFYIDGTLAGTVTVSGAFDGNATTAFLGSHHYATTQHCHCILDDVRVYNRAFTQADVTLLHAYAEAPPPTVPLVLRFVR